MESAGIWASLLGGIGLFLLGMQMMTAGLTQAAGPALRSGLEFATRSRLRAFAVGTGITALTQSSSAVTVASIGFANAGLVSFANLVWVIYGTSLGNTMTGWIVALMGAKFSIGALARHRKVNRPCTKTGPASVFMRLRVERCRATHPWRRHGVRESLRMSFRGVAGETGWQSGHGWKRNAALAEAT